MFKIAYRIAGADPEMSACVGRRFAMNIRKMNLILTAFLFIFCLTAGPLKAVDLTTSNAQLSGEIIRATGSVITFKLDVGRIINLAPKDISTVSMRLQDGTLTEGTFLSWNNGVYVLSVGDVKTHIQDGRIIESTSLIPPAEEIDEALNEGVGSGGPETGTEPPQPAAPPSPAEPTPIENNPRQPQSVPSGATM